MDVQASGAQTTVHGPWGVLEVIRYKIGPSTFELKSYLFRCRGVKLISALGPHHVLIRREVYHT